MNISDSAKQAAKNEVFEASNPRSLVHLGFYVQTAIDAETAPLKSEIERLKKELENANSDYSAEADHRDGLLKDQGELKTDLKLAHEKISRLEEFINRCSRNFKDVERERLSEKSRANAAEKEREDLLIANGSIHHENDRLKAELDRLSESYERIDRSEKKSESTLAEMREALEKLVNKLNLIFADNEYRAVWECSQLHRGRYSGPKCNQEMDAAKQALSTDAGKGWLSPEDAASLQSRLDDARSQIEIWEKTALRREPFAALLRFALKHCPYDPNCKPGSIQCDCGLEKIFVDANAELERTKSETRINEAWNEIDFMGAGKPTQKTVSELITEIQKKTKGGDELCPLTQQTADALGNLESSGTHKTASIDNRKTAVSTSPVSVQSGDGAELKYTETCKSCGMLMSSNVPIDYELCEICKEQETDWTDPKNWEQVPEWVVAIAKDRSDVGGAVHGYEKKDVQPSNNMGAWIKRADEKSILLPNIYIPGDWKESLMVRPTATVALDSIDNEWERDQEAGVTEVRDTTRRVEDQRAFDMFVASLLPFYAAVEDLTWQQTFEKCFAKASEAMAEREKRREK